MNIEEIVKQLVNKHEITEEGEIEILRRYIIADNEDEDVTADIITEAFNTHSEPLISALEDYMQNYFPELN